MPLPIFCMVLMSLIGLGVLFVMLVIGFVQGKTKDSPPRILTFTLFSATLIALVGIGAVVNESYSTWSEHHVSDIASRNDKIHDSHWRVDKDCSVITYTPASESANHLKASMQKNAKTVNVSGNDEVVDQLVVAQPQDLCIYKSPSTITNVKNYLVYTLQDKASSDN